MGDVQWWLAFVERAGGVAAVLEFGALMWLGKDRVRVLLENAELRKQLDVKASEVKDLAERVITIATELRMFLFNERKS